MKDCLALIFENRTYDFDRGRLIVTQEVVMTIALM